MKITPAKSNRILPSFLTLPKHLLPLNNVTVGLHYPLLLLLDN